MTLITDLVQQNDIKQLLQAKLKTERFYFIENQGWFFHCRDGKRGPYITKLKAEQDLNSHIQQD